MSKTRISSLLYSVFHLHSTDIVYNISVEQGRDLALYINNRQQ